MLAIVTGVAAFIISINFIKPQKEAVVTDTGTMVVTAANDIRIGTKILKKDIDLLPAPSGVNAKILFTEMNQVIGKLSRSNISKGTAIRTLDLYEEGESLASLIPPGYRAMSIPVTMSGSLSKLVYAGNRVDVLLTYRRGMGDFQTITLVKNAKVIDVTQSGQSSGGEVQMSITLAVTPEGAKTLAFAMEKGTLKVAVYSMEDVEREEQERFFTLKELFFQEEEKTYRELIPTQDGVETIRGLRKEKQKFDSERMGTS